MPVITGMTNVTGPASGGTTVTIVGTRFAGTRTVLFGASKARKVVWLSSSKLQAVAPIHAPGPFFVRVVTTAGTSAPTSKGVFHYVAAPVVTALSAHSGPIVGDQLITVSGRYLAGVKKVAFGSLAGQSVKVLSDTRLQVKTPVAWPSAVDVRVTSVGGTSARSAADRFTFALPTSGSSASYVPKDQTVVLDPSGVITVTGGQAADPNPDGTQAPWQISMSSDATLPAVGDTVLLRPGAVAYPSGLAGQVVSLAPQQDGSTIITASAGGLESVLSSAVVDYTGSLEGHTVSAGQRTGPLSHEDALTGEVHFGDIDANIMACHADDGTDVTVTGSIGLKLTNVKTHFEVNAGSLFTDPFVDIYVSYEPIVVANVTAEKAAKCQIPTWWQSLHKKLFLIGDTGATIAIAPDASITVSAGVALKFEQHSYRTIGFISQPDGSIRKIDGKSTDPADVSVAVELKAEVYVGVQIQVGVLDVVGVGISAGMGLRGEAEIELIPYRNLCLSYTPFARATLYAYLNLWVAEWKLQAFQLEYDFGGGKKCWPLPGADKPDASLFGKILRVSTTGDAFLVDSAGAKHRINDGGIYLCLKAWKGIPVVEGTQSQADALADGDPAGCSVPEAFGQIVRVGATGKAYLVDGVGARHSIPDGGVYLCLRNWKGVGLIDNLSQEHVDALPEGTPATCTIPEAYNTMLRVGATGASYFVDGSGVRHWIPDGGTYLCFRYWKHLGLYDNLTTDDVNAFPTGGTATCTIPEAYNTIVRVEATGKSYYVDGSGVKHSIPDGGVYDCLYYWKGVSAYEHLLQAHVDAFPTGGTATCTIPEAYNTIVRVEATGKSYYVDGSGVKHSIPDGGVYDCLFYWKGVTAYEHLLQGHIDAFPTGGNATCTIPEAYNTIVRVEATGKSYYVDGSGVKHSIPNGGVYDCLFYWKGVSAYEHLQQGHVDAFPTGGDQGCTVPEAYNTIVRVEATGASYYVDGSGVKHWIPDGYTFNCLYYWRGISAYWHLQQGHVDTFANGGNWSCSVPEAYNKIVRVEATGKAYMVDGGGTRHSIPDGRTYLCLYYWKNVPAYEHLEQGHVDSFPQGGDQGCSVPEANNTIIRETTSGKAYYVDGSNVRHWIQDGATYNCLAKSHDIYHDLTWDYINAFAEGAAQPKSSC